MRGLCHVHGAPKQRHQGRGRAQADFVIACFGPSQPLQQGLRSRLVYVSQSAAVDIDFLQRFAAVELGQFQTIGALDIP